MVNVEGRVTEHNWIADLFSHACYVRYFEPRASMFWTGLRERGQYIRNYAIFSEKNLSIWKWWNHAILNASESVLLLFHQGFIFLGSLLINGFPFVARLITQFVESQWTVEPFKTITCPHWPCMLLMSKYSREIWLCPTLEQPHWAESNG